jgi:succinate dehydrogenase / fumarate reductase cytochrome b subunit
MVPLKKALNSSLGRKYLMSVSGLAMVGFIVTHLLGNLQLYGDGTAFNAYAKGLHDLGPLLWVAELGLIGIFLLHVAVALGLQVSNRKAAGPVRYQAAQRSKGGPSYFSVFSRGMIFTGGILFVFIVTHVLHFKYGVFSPAEIANKTTTVNGEQATDLYARVVHAFKNPGWVAFYMFCMGVVFAHLRHGFWSAFQSIGALNWRLEKPATLAAIVVAAALSAGFLGIPVYIFLTNL